MSHNPRNNGSVTGRLARDVKFFTNKDNSHTVKFTVMADNNYKNRDGKRGSEAVPVETFLPNTVTEPGVYALINQGALVRVDYTVRTRSFERNGETVYETYLDIEDVTLLESKATSEARKAQRATGEWAQPQAAQQVAPAFPAANNSANAFAQLGQQG